MAVLVTGAAVGVPVWLRPLPGPEHPGTSATAAVAAHSRPPQVRAGPRDAARAAAVLRRWDLARARAWAGGDERRLRALYAAGSTAGAADVRMLRAWSRRSLTVSGLRTQLLRVEVQSEGDGLWQLVVTDRVSGADVVAPSGRVRRLPAGPVTTRLVTLLRAGERWQVSSVRPA